ncbi:MAG: hypothetical protein K5821_05045 [Nitrobacter sp.]|nr:hypothetical protein [Nitrobacter sp.]
MVERKYRFKTDLLFDDHAPGDSSIRIPFDRAFFADVRNQGPLANIKALGAVLDLTFANPRQNGWRMSNLLRQRVSESDRRDPDSL